MAEEQNNQGGGGKGGHAPIIIKKVKKGGGHGHHGGAWKVAYADFVTAMMAFFLLLWLLNVTTKDQKEGIADYFSPSPTMSITKSGSGPGVLGGESPSQQRSINQAPMPFELVIERPAGNEGEKKEDKGQQQSQLTEEQLEEMMTEVDKARFDQAEKDLKQAIRNIPELQELAKSLIIDQTPEGLRIQIVDQESRPMFPSGSDAMYDYTNKLIKLVAEVVHKMPNEIAIAGHTDSVPYRPGSDYTNWELSSDRANATRRALIDAGLEKERIARVSGRAATELLLKDESRNPRNRRISILLLRENQQPKGSTP